MKKKNLLTFNEVSRELKAQDVGITIGNFDGVHLGHTKLLKNFVQECRSRGLKPILFTISPHPYFYFNSDGSNYLIQSYEEKYQSLIDLGVENIIELEFNKELQMHTAIEFINLYFKPFTKTKLIYIGYDFSIGCDKSSGIVELKNSYSNSETKIIEEIEEEVDNKTVSSTRIRECLRDGDIKSVNKLLGRNYSITSSVTSGKGIGSKKLLATANIVLDSHRLYPSIGVYLVHVRHLNKLYSALTNVGINPTTDSDNKLKIETYLLDADINLYDEVIEIQFEKRLRNEMKFSGFSELKAELDKDVENARIYFEKN